MITKTNTPRFTTSDQTEFKTIEEAQVHELAQLLDAVPVTDVPKYLVDNAEKIVDVLTMTPRSVAKARAVNGGRKPRKNSTTPAVLPEPAKAA